MWQQQGKAARTGDVSVGLLVSCVLCVAGCRVGSFGGDVPSTAKRLQCQANLRTLYDALEKYVSTHGDLPRSDDGKVSIGPLGDYDVQKELGIDSSVLKCPADESLAPSSYVLNPALSVKDLRPDSATIVACDRAANHLRPRVQDGMRIVLIGDGSTVVMALPLEEQDEWLRLFLAGDESASTVSTSDGAKGNWTSSSIMWYVGQEKGRVPNSRRDGVPRE